VKENEIFTDVGAAADFYFRFYSDAAGTVRTTLPADVVINWRMHFYWTYNGGPPTGEDYNIIEIIRADAGMDEVSLKDVETLNCRYGGDCVHFEPTLSGGRYVMIP
jgi:hypothetical protein